MLRLFSSAAAAGSMLGHKHHRSDDNQMDRHHESHHESYQNEQMEDQHQHMRHHESHRHNEGPQPYDRTMPAPDHRRQPKHHGKHRRSENQNVSHPLHDFKEFLAAKLAKKPVTRETYLGGFKDKKDQFVYGGWKTYIQQLGLVEAQDCLHQQVVVDMDYALAIMEMWKGDNRLKSQGAMRLVDTIMTDLALKKSCMNPFDDEKKVMRQNWLQGQKRFLSGKTMTEDSEQIKGYLKLANTLRKNQDYAMAGQYAALAYLSWTGYEVDTATLPKTIVGPVEETPLALQGTEIIGGILYGLFESNSLATVDEQCFPELGQFVKDIDSAWTTMNTYIVGDIEDGYTKLVNTVSKLPEQLQKCEGYDEDMMQLDAYAMESKVGTTEFADELHEYMVEHAWDADLHFIQAIDYYVKADWTSFGVALGAMMQ